MLKTKLVQIGRTLSRCYTSEQGRPSATGTVTSTVDKAKTSGSHDASTGGDGYKSPEYYQHNTFSYVDYDVVMVKYRLPQPSSKQPK